jgi:hypothetical protein
MLRKLVGLVVLLCIGGLVAAQDKDKGKGKEPPRVKAKLLSVDVKKSSIDVEISGKKQTLEVGKDTKVLGPRGGKTTLKDKRLTPGVMLGLVFKGKVLDEIHIPVITKAKDKDKGKDKDKK